jgi:predicted nucleotidyltransferase
MPDFAQLIKSNDYDFLRYNNDISGKIMFITLGGSWSYGTNNENSDIDIRGCVANSKSSLLGLHNFECYVDKVTDTTLYSFNKLAELLISCNPNTIEMLGCKKEHYLFVNDLGQELIENADLFLSKRALYSFGGYARDQLRRLENNIARFSSDQSIKEKHILDSVKSAMQSVQNRYSKFENGSINLHIGESENPDLDSEILIDVDLKNYPLRDYRCIWSEFNEIIKSYGKINHRSRKKDDNHLNKHAMHLLRLYMTGIDILEKQKIITYRTDEHNLLMKVRNGEFFNNETQSFTNEFFDILKFYENKLEYAAANTSLPDNPDTKKVEELMISINEKSLSL